MTNIYHEIWFIDGYIMLYFECINININYICTYLNIRQYYLKPVLSSMCENSTIRCSIISHVLNQIVLQQRDGMVFVNKSNTPKKSPHSIIDTSE